MTNPANADPTLDRLLRHMAWANATLFGPLADLPDDDLGPRRPGTSGGWR